MRYEDALSDQERILREIFEFVLNLEKLDGTIIENRINAMMEDKGHGASLVYKPSSLVVGKNAHRFSPELL